MTSVASSALAILAALLVLASNTALSAAEPSSSAITVGTSFALPSTALGTTRQVNVWLPPSYESGNRTYAVLYVIDGGLAQDFHHISGLAQLATINGNFQELIVVGIATETRILELTSPPTDPRYIRNPPTAGNSAKFRAHLEREVIPFIEHRYRTGKRRALIGESLAGLFVIETFLKTPLLFTDYIAISPSLWWDDKALAKQAASLLQSHDTTPRHLYLTMADEGGTMQRGLDMVIAAIEAKNPPGLDWHYVDRRMTEHHQTIYHGAALDALRRLFGVPIPEPSAPPPWYLVEGGQPPSPEEN